MIHLQNTPTREKKKVKTNALKIAGKILSKCEGKMIWQNVVAASRFRSPMQLLGLLKMLRTIQCPMTKPVSLDLHILLGARRASVQQQ